MQVTSINGRVEIASHEGIVNSRYKDSVGVWTIGIGHTAAAGGVDPAKVTRELSIKEVFAIFKEDLPKYERRVRKAFTKPLTQEQFDAAVSFDFNTGGIHRASWVKHFNAGRIAAARRTFMNWSKPPEIIPRRRAERDLFFSGKYSSNGSATVYPATTSGRVQWRKGQRVNVGLILKAPEYTAVPIKEYREKQAEKLAEKRSRKAKGATAGFGAIAAGGVYYYWEQIKSALCFWC